VQVVVGGVHLCREGEPPCRLAEFCRRRVGGRARPHLEVGPRGRAHPRWEEVDARDRPRMATDGAGLGQSSSARQLCSCWLESGKLSKISWGRRPASHGTHGGGAGGGQAATWRLTAWRKEKELA